MSNVIASGLSQKYLDKTGIYMHGNILGTVSQSAGVPTGAVIESGSVTNNGYTVEYTKFADGTAKQWLSAGGVPLDTGLINPGEFTRFDFSVFPSYPFGWSGAQVRLHGRGAGGGGNRMPLLFSGRPNELAIISRVVTSEQSNGSSNATAFTFDLYMELTHRWY